MQVRIWKTGDPYSNLQAAFVIGVLPRGCWIFRLFCRTLPGKPKLFFQFSIYISDNCILILFRDRFPPVFWGSPAFVTKKTIKIRLVFMHPSFLPKKQAVKHAIYYYLSAF